MMMMMRRRRREPAFWRNMMPYHLQGSKVSWELNQLADCCSWFLAWPSLRSLRWRWCVPPKRRVLSELHSMTSQKTVRLIVTAVRATNLRKSWDNLISVHIDLNSTRSSDCHQYSWNRLGVHSAGSYGRT
jgi:hypothetical protein